MRSTRTSVPTINKVPIQPSARQAGVGSTELRFLNEPPKHERLRTVELPPEPAFDSARVALAANVARLNDVVFGPQDYALVARKATA